ncbi:hypothetical protein [Hydrogenophaga laconesensis]|uniref:Uncharacterized protein n=1 Tax=Hydrogenophaga laconesensis TaxID=1805971 RepID=A0ABU1VDT7_9BURK|nr:hypothetical protein [Hydrogenophaga laconesensis]MDR7095338.1 hypothetical protein [Hydrogenophaga laconesensis]
MTGERDATVRTVLRGEPLRQQLDAGNAQRHPAPPTPTAPPTAGGDGTVRLINGVPASAAVHCCGRGCAHCRIYWRKNDV